MQFSCGQGVRSPLPVKAEAALDGRRKGSEVRTLTSEGATFLDTTVHPRLSEEGQWTRKAAVLLCQCLYFIHICTKFQFKPVHILCKWTRMKSFFDITEDTYAERTGNQKSTKKIFRTSSGVAYLSKEGSVSLLTYKTNEGKGFPGADLELYPLVLCIDQLLERTVKHVVISVVFP